MRTRPSDLSDDEVAAALADGWGIAATSTVYQPVGFGSHHWDVRDTSGQRWFVTVDDLPTCIRLPGDTADDAYARLAGAFGTAYRLGRRGLPFVLPPVARPCSPSDGPDVITRLTPRYSLVVHPYVDGTPAGQHDGFDRAVDRDAILDALGVLHDGDLADEVAGLAPVDDPGVPFRSHLEAALAERGNPAAWDTGPYGEPARRLLAEHAEPAQALLRTHDRLAAPLADARRVVTHGEPHAANVLVHDGRCRLVDWESLALAPPERDLAALDGGDAVLAAYTARTGRPADPEAVRAYHVRWDLWEIALYVALFRAPHTETADVRESWAGLRHYLRPTQRWPSLVAS